jgi:hypothetical protein
MCSQFLQIPDNHLAKLPPAAVTGGDGRQGNLRLLFLKHQEKTG